MDNLKYAIFRVNSYASKTAEQLATALVADAALTPVRLTTAFQEAFEAGASLNELGKVYSQMNNEFVINLRDALHQGDLVQTSILIAIAVDQLQWSQATQDAVDSVLNTYTLTLVEQVANEFGEGAPESLSAADVTSALNAAGYTWNGSAWTFTGIN